MKTAPHQRRNMREQALEYGHVSLSGREVLDLLDDIDELLRVANAILDAAEDRIAELTRGWDDAVAKQHKRDIVYGERWDALQAENARLTRERDEALAKVAKLREALGAADEALWGHVGDAYQASEVCARVREAIAETDGDK